jgi:hypothetical protein
MQRIRTRQLNLRQVVTSLMLPVRVTHSSVRCQLLLPQVPLTCDARDESELTATTGTRAIQHQCSA